MAGMIPREAPAVLNFSDASGEPAGAHARQPGALTSDVRLIRIANRGGRGGELPSTPPEREEALEPKHPVQGLGAVADRLLEHAPKLTLAEVEGVAQGPDAAARATEPPHGLEHERRRLLDLAQPAQQDGQAALQYLPERHAQIP